MKTILIIDAYAMIYRAYYAYIRAPRMNSRGENTSAIFGFIITLEDLIKRIKPTHIAVAFDPAGPTFRHEVFEEYKAQRQETPEDIRRAVPKIKQILLAMNIPILEMAGYEADDLIGTLSKQADQAGFEVYMATPDKDYGQLVSERVFMYRPRHTGGFEKMGPREVCEKYGLQNPMQVIDLLGLMGDSSDNIPGCKGVGEKTAVQLLQQFGSIDNLLANTHQLKGALQRKVEEQADNIRFSRFLVTIKTDAPIIFEEQSFVYQERNWDQLVPLYRELEFNSLLKQAPKEISKPTVKTTKKAQVQEATLDLFASIETPSESIVNDEATNPNPQIEDRLAAYLLNPELAFNPNIPVQWDALKADSALWALYQDVELPLVHVLKEMEQEGVRVDVDMLRKAEHELTLEMNALEEQVYQLTNRSFNINSPKQVGEILFDELKLDSRVKKSKSGNYSTSEEVLQSIKDKHPVVGLIINYRELKKLISTYITALPTYINPQTGKIHTTYNQTTTATGRLSSSNPNLQNLPIRSERGQLIRSAVIPDDGCMFLSADYSQIELRLMAHFSQDPHLLHAFHSGQDIHAATAAKIFAIPIEDVTKEQRRQAKTANFGIIYGISAFGLAQQLDCSRADAKALIDGYFAAFPGVIDYIERQKEIARKTGYAITLFGRKRYLPDILSHNATVRSFAERNAVNSPIQGTAADIIKMAMVTISRRLKEEGLKAKMIMQVHDELNFNVPLDEVDRVKQLVVNEMQNVVHLSVPLIAQCGVGKNWLDAH